MIKIAAMFVSALILLWLLLSFAAGYRLTRRSKPRYAELAPLLDWGIIKSESLLTSDGEQIGAWIIEGNEHAPSILLIHGNGGCRSDCLDLAKVLAAEGLTVMLITLRAHGDSSGAQNDIGYSARHDVIAAVEYLEQKHPQRPIFLLGRSLGGAAAAFAGAELGRRVKGYILDGVYRDLRTAVYNRLKERLLPGLDRLAYGGMMLIAPLVISDLKKIAPVDALSRIPADVRVLILSGNEDRQARPNEASALYNSVKTHGIWVAFEGAGHTQQFEMYPETYRRIVLDFISSPTLPVQEPLVITRSNR